MTLWVKNIVITMGCIYKKIPEKKILLSTPICSPLFYKIAPQKFIILNFCAFQKNSQDTMVA